MKQYETRVRPAREFRHCVTRKCDICGTESKRSYEGRDWDAPFGTLRVQAELEDGFFDDITGNGKSTIWDVDICPSCFQSQLLPWLASKGVNVEPKREVFKDGDSIELPADAATLDSCA